MEQRLAGTGQNLVDPPAGHHIAAEKQHDFVHRNASVLDLIQTSE
jgi:hypothetical protein